MRPKALFICGSVNQICSRARSSSSQGVGRGCLGSLHGGLVHGHAADVTRREPLEQLRDEVLATSGHLQVLVNSAAIDDGAAGPGVYRQHRLHLRPGGARPARVPPSRRRAALLPPAAVLAYAHLRCQRLGGEGMTASPADRR